VQTTSEVLLARRKYSILLGFAVLAIMCLSSLAACTDQEATTPMTNPHVAALEQLPAFQLAYPGATLLRQGALPPSKGIDGDEGATAAKVYGIAASVPAEVTPQAIVAWYHPQLQTQGWSQYFGSYLTGFLVQEFWLKANYYVRIAVYNPKYTHDYEPAVDTTKYPIVFGVFIGER
jgi:hypothetical protein